MSKVMLRKISANVKSNIKCKRKVKYVLLSKISTKVKRVKSTTECKRKVLLNASVKNIVLFITLIHE
jgi:hypothetical protein